MTGPNSCWHCFVYSSYYGGGRDKERERKVSKQIDSVVKFTSRVVDV